MYKKSLIIWSVFLFLVLHVQAQDADQQMNDAREIFDSYAVMVKSIGNAAGQIKDSINTLHQAQAQSKSKLQSAGLTTPVTCGAAQPAISNIENHKPSEFPTVLQINFISSVTREEVADVLAKYGLGPVNGESLSKYILTANGWKIIGEHASAYDVVVPCPESRQPDIVAKLSQEGSVVSATRYVFDPNL